MTITSTELAKLCNVSRATVDRVFNNRGIVNEATKNKILETAKAVGYRPNYIAQSLVTGKTFSVGIVIPGLNNYFFSTLLNGISKKAQANRYIPLIALYEDDPQFELECIASLIERRVDGLILFSTGNSKAAAEILKKHKIPAVMVLNELDGFPCVRIDYCQAMCDATNYVISKGYRHLVFLCPPLGYGKDRNTFAIQQRYEGFQKALCAHAEQSIDYTVIDSNDYIEKIVSIKRMSEQKTAVLCSSDIYALTLMKALKTRGFHIPLDIGIIGFDGIEILDYLEPSVATVDIPIQQIGEVAAQYLIDLLTNGSSTLGTQISYSINPGQSIV